MTEEDTLYGTISPADKELISKAVQLLLHDHDLKWIDKT
jgi:hypothetical protein